MPSCLGLYIEKNLIKYAKVSKERENINIDSFGIKFYDKLDEAIKQIVTETYSFKIPISVNLSEEMYAYFYMFKLLNNTDIEKAIKTEFGSFCYDKNMNENAFESRYAIMDSLEDKDKIKVLYCYANKNEINRKNQQFEQYKLGTISPISTTIANLADVKSKENVAIVNIEDKTTITTIIDKKVYDIDIIEKGSVDILDRINAKENSYTKSYNICKNSTIYTMEGKDLQEEENEYLEDIVPVLFEIATKTKEILAEKIKKIDKVYITGTASVINNVDLYFQEFLTECKCEILKPYFITNSVKINIKDYIEVNSAIALALQGLGYGIKAMNFKNKTLSDDFKKFISMEANSGKTKGIKGSFFKNDLGEKLDKAEIWMVRTAVGLLVLSLIYSGFSIFLNSEINRKSNEVDDLVRYTNKQIASIEKDSTEVITRTRNYQKMIDSLDNLSERVTQKYENKNAIPTLLSQLMSIIPKGVKITSIENTSGKKVEIKAQSEQYEQLGYFKVKIKSDGILVPTSVVSTQGIKQGNVVTVTIEGELP